MKLKFDVFNHFKLFKASFEKTKAHRIISLTTDNSGKYMSKLFEEFLRKDGIDHIPSPPHSPQLNGVAERTNRTIGNLIRCSLISSRLPKPFWTDALRHSLFTFKSIPCHTPRGFATPNLILGMPEIEVSYTHPFGCLA